VIIPFLKDLSYGYQFRPICWNYPGRDLFQEQKVQMHLFFFFVGDEILPLNRNILRPFNGSNLSVKKKSVQLSLVHSMKVCGRCFWNFEQ